MSFYLGNRSIVNLNHVKNIFFDYSPPSKKWLVGVNFMDGERDTLSVYETEQECQKELDSLFKKMWGGQKMRCPFCKEYIFSDCPEGPEWISVKDQEPDPSLGRILVVSKLRNTYVLHRIYDEWCLTECEYDDGMEVTGESVEFTHWMKIPDLPS